MSSPRDHADALAARIRALGPRLRADPPGALTEAQALVRAVPGHPVATLFLGMALRDTGNLSAGLAVLQPLATRHPDSAAIVYELGVTLGACGRRDEAVAALQRAVAIEPAIGEAWRLIADHRMAAGDPGGADAAWANHLVAQVGGPRLREPVAALCAGRLPEAERLLRTFLAQHPGDPAALRLLAEIAIRIGRSEDAIALLEACLAGAPDFVSARHARALALHEINRNEEALAELELLLASGKQDPSWLNLRANVLSRLGEHDRAIEAFDAVLADHPSNPRIWIACGDALKTAGRTSDGIAAYRHAIGLAPGYGEPWWSLANLKTFRFDPADIEAMRRQLARPDMADDDRVHLEFALGKALEDEASYADAFVHYAAGNRLRRRAVPYDPAVTTAFVGRCRELLSEEFLARRRGWGTAPDDPIFIVGLPRSGSTLLEQILASHPMIEGTAELPDVPSIARAIGNPAAVATRYPEVLANLGADEFRALGDRYLRQTQVHRRRGAPRFVDKMPNNWMHVGLIHLMLPNARILDVRREPMACGWSCFRQHFARGQHFTYSLEDLGRYYRDYVDLMSHIDAVLPGRVCRVSYERLVEDTEAEVRRVLAHCGLPFDAACLRFHESSRAVATASSEQVRRPMYREALSHWRHFEPWLRPLRDALGPAVPIDVSGQQPSSRPAARDDGDLQGG
jgi:tetratricopeptide (TPR) repeat protein